MIRSKSLPNLRHVTQGYLPDGIPLSETYSAVFALDVVEHVERDGDALATLASMLCPGGKLVLTVPAYQWLWSGHDVANHHFRRYDKSRITTLIRKTGLDIEFSSYFNTLLFPLKLAQHLKNKLFPPSRRPMGSGASREVSKQSVEASVFS